VSKSAKNDNRTTAKNDNRATTAKRATHPWADINGIDYGPAVAALGDLVAWTFDLAAADVADWPEGRRRVKSTRRYVLARLRGHRARRVPFEDILFTAGLLARIFETEFGLGMSEMVAVLDRIGLPTEVVPLMPRVQPHARTPLGRPAVATGPFLRRSVAIDAPVAPPCEDCGHSPAVCEECGCDLCPGYRNAA